MGKCGRHLSHGAQPRNVNEFGLQLLQSSLCLLTLAQVANEPGEETPAARIHFADSKLDRKGGAVLALGDDDATDADNALLSSIKVAVEIVVVLIAIRVRH